MLMDNNKEIIKVIAEKEVCGKQFRVWNTPEEPLFLAKDVADWLGYSKKNGVQKVVSLVDKEDISKCKMLVPCKLSKFNKQPYKKYEVCFINEDGLYDVLFTSIKPMAKVFRKEVKKVLKEIRLTGGYIPTTDDMTDEELMARAYEIAQRTINMRVNQLN